jgi:amino acid transporter
VSTFGTILVLLVYALSNLALPLYYKKFHPDQFSVVKHIVLPLLGIVAIAIPMYYLVKPGQATPYSWFPYAALAFLVLALVYSFILVGRNPSLGESIGSIVADE